MPAGTSLLMPLTPFGAQPEKQPIFIAWLVRRIAATTEADNFVTTTEKLTVCICIYSQVHLGAVRTETVSFSRLPPSIAHLINSTHFVLFPALEIAPPIGLHQPWPDPTTLRANIH